MYNVTAQSYDRLVILEADMPKDTFTNLPEKKREAITIVLLEEFATREYRSVSISAIVKKAGIAKGSFYQYFEDKADCYLYLIQLALQEKMDFINQIPPSNQNLDLFGNLRWMMEAGTKFEFSNPLLAQISYRAVFEDVPLPEETMTFIRQGSRAYFKGQLEQGIAEGLINQEIDPELGAFVFDAIFTNIGKHLMDQFDISPQNLLEGGASTFASTDSQHMLNQVITILERGFRAAEN